MSRHVVIGLGEVLWDVFPDQRRLGGAPANVAFHSEVLGEDGVIVSCVGDDEPGSALIDQLNERGLRTEMIQVDATAPTGTVTVEINDDEPFYTITEDVAWDYLDWNHGLARLAITCDAACFSTLCQRSPTSRATVTTFLKSMQRGALRVLDVNLRPPFIDEAVLRTSVSLANVVKVNESEAEMLAGFYGVSDLADHLIANEGVDLVCLTRGKDGCRLYRAEEVIDQPGIEKDTSSGDAVGVGDAFIAAVIHELLCHAPLERIAKFANRYAAMVATKRGGMPREGTRNQ